MTADQHIERAQANLDRRRAQLGIARPADAGDRIQREVDAAVERRARSKAPAAIATNVVLPVAPVTAVEEIDLDDPYSPPIPEGEYLAIYVATERGRVHGNGRLFVHFRITAGEHAGRRLIRFYNEKRGARLARSSSLWRDFVRLIDRKPPSAGFKPSWMVSGCEVRVRVVTVHERIEDGERVEMVACERYSKIDALLAITAGTPPALGGGDAQKKRTSPSPTTGTSTAT